MLSKEQIKKIADLIRVKEEDLSAAIADEKELDIEMPELTVFNKTELESRDRNTQKQHYDAGKQAGSELLVKDMKEKYGIEVDGKDPDKLMESYKRKFRKKQRPNRARKLRNWKASFRTLKPLTPIWSVKKGDIEGRFRKESVKSGIIMGLEKEYLLSKGDMLNLMTSSGYEFEEENGKTVTKLHGNIVRDEKTQDPLPFASVFDSFAEAKKLTKPTETPDATPPFGRGVGSTRKLQSAFTSMSEFKKHWESQDKSVNSSDFAAAALKASEESGNPDFMKQ